MTVTSTINKSQTTANGTVTQFFFDFEVPEEPNLQVYLNDVLQLSGYTVAGIDNPSGGSVTFAVAPAAGVLVTLLREMQITQEVDYQPYDPFPAATAENTIDKLTMICQQQQEQLNRAWKVPIDTTPGADIDPPSYQAGMVLGWSETTPNELVNYPGIDTFQSLIDDSQAAAAAAASSQSAAAGSASAAAGSAGAAQSSAAQSANSAQIAQGWADAANVDKIVWMGSYVGTTAYAESDAVESGGSSYVASAPTTGVAPPAAPWQLMASKGAKGDTGQSGPGTGDVNGPGSSTTNQIALFADGTGQLLKTGVLVGTAAGANVQTSASDATAGRVLLVGAAASALGSDVVSESDLGTAAYRNVQTSATDTTAGALMAVGAFGVGSSNAPLVSNPNTVAVNGLYRVIGSANTPTTGAYTLIHEQYDASAIQHLTEVSSPVRQFVRTSAAGTWQPWVELLLGDSGAQFPVLVNGFSDKGSFRYRKVGKTVYITGTVGHNAAWPAVTTIFTLPVGYRPAGPVSQVAVAISSNLAYYQTTITANPDGAVSTGIVYTYGGTPTGLCSTTVNIAFPVA